MSKSIQGLNYFNQIISCTGSACCSHDPCFTTISTSGQTIAQLDGQQDSDSTSSQQPTVLPANHKQKELLHFDRITNLKFSTVQDNAV